MQWISSSLGQFFATIGGDNKFKVWQEDPSQRIAKGRRFRCVYSQSPPNHVSYVSFSFKSIKHDIWLALMTHDGLLSLAEPADPESFSSWNQIDQLYPFGQHHRGTEAKFRLSFHQSEGPSSNALLAGLDFKAMSLAVSALSFVKIYRAIKPEDSSEGNYKLHELLQIDIANASINEIAWAPGCLHPFDVIATACDDGIVRIFHVDTNNEGDDFSEAARRPQPDGVPVAQGPAARNAPSGISAGLAGMARSTPSRKGIANEMNIKHVSKEVAMLPHDDGSPVWKVRWLYDGKENPSLRYSYANPRDDESYRLKCFLGSALASTGDNGKVHLWRESLNGGYIEFADTEPV